MWFFFFKQKTAYEMRISDWSSDVCSSDLFMMMGFSPVMSVFWATIVSFLTSFLRADSAMISYDLFRGKGKASEHFFQSRLIQAQIGRASCGERVCQYV